MLCRMLRMVTASSRYVAIWCCYSPHASRASKHCGMASTLGRGSHEKSHVITITYLQLLVVMFYHYASYQCHSLHSVELML
jgi:hypothetical protein